MFWYILLFIGAYILDRGYFEIIHHYYCKKNKGNCYNCEDWSCPRQQYLKKYCDYCDKCISCYECDKKGCFKFQFKKFFKRLFKK